MIKIPIQGKLGVGKYALVDDEFSHLAKMKWYGTADDGGHAVTFIRNDKGKRKTIYMHKLIIPYPKGFEVDHKNRNKLDNRKQNLRPCTVFQNKMNTKMGKQFSSKYKGVSWNKPMRKWQARIRDHYKRKSLGYFVDEIEAARAYNKAAKELYGEFAYLNVLPKQSLRAKHLSVEGGKI